jgi:hypothetical protein
MVSRILAQVIENLCILHDGVGALSQVQKFIELVLNESFRYMVCSKDGPELIPGDNMISRLHGIKMIPPQASCAAELLSYKKRLVFI